ncbi:MAG: hypothetical protein H0X03_08930, partial [Nitrosopumilus sp.]|nr:hypothetical protein [Nitrosopumilus sp.]
PYNDINEFRIQEKKIPHGKVIDTWVEGRVFSQELPNDYLSKSIRISIDKKYDIKNIDLRSLHPLDIVVTKLGRYNNRDIEDIENCIRKSELTADQIRSRAEEVIAMLPGNEEVYRMNLDLCLKTNFEFR